MLRVKEVLVWSSNDSSSFQCSCASPSKSGSSTSKISSKNNRTSNHPSDIDSDNGNDLIVSKTTLTAVILSETEVVTVYLVVELSQLTTLFTVGTIGLRNGLVSGARSRTRFT